MIDSMSSTSLVQKVRAAHALLPGLFSGRTVTGLDTPEELVFTPHLISNRSRKEFRSYSRLIQKDLFAKYVFEVWIKFESEGLPKPRYLQLLMLVAVHTFIREKVDVAICETHNDGEYDATDIFTHPIVTGIATIGMDHVLQLGPIIENIAWHISGIVKSCCPVFSVAQEHQISAVLRRRASDKKVSSEFVEDDTVNNSDVLAMKTAEEKCFSCSKARQCLSFTKTANIVSHTDTRWSCAGIKYQEH